MGLSPFKVLDFSVVFYVVVKSYAHFKDMERNGNGFYVTGDLMAL